MSRTVGYIVNGYIGPKHLVSYYKPKGCRKGVLMNGGPVTMFKTRSRAKGAIERTIKFAEEQAQSDNKYWVGDLKIQRAESEPEATNE